MSFKCWIKSLFREPARSLSEWLDRRIGWHKRCPSCGECCNCGAPCVICYCEDGARCDRSGHGPR